MIFPNSSIARTIDGVDQFSFEALVKAWKWGLKDVADEQINTGLEALRVSGNTFEPSMTEFRTMCKGSNAPYHRDYVALPKPKADPEIARQAIAEMRRVLRG